MKNPTKHFQATLTALISALLLFSFVNHANAQFSISGSNGNDGNYTSLTNAGGVFAALNTTSQTGYNITVTVTGNSTSETGATALTGAAGMWTSLTIQPDQAVMRTISGNIAGPLFNFNGAGGITIDGRPAGTGTTKYLSISNTSSSQLTGTSTIQFINGASNNKIKYCIIKGSTGANDGTYRTSGIIYFAISSSNGGNSENKIDNCDITNAGTRSLCAIFSKGTAIYKNSNDTISNCNIYDIPTETGINYMGTIITNIYDYTENWLISGNSFYLTTLHNPSSYITFYPIYINSSFATGITISDNYIGGSAPHCGGAALTKTNGLVQSFYGMFVSLGSTGTCDITGNTVSNIIWATSNGGSYGFYGLSLSGGVFNVSGNTIGSATGNNSIQFTNSSTTNNYSQSFYGIYFWAGASGNITNNTVGSIKTISTSAGTYASHFYGIYSSGMVNTENNLIGSLSTSNSINLSSPVSGAAQNCYGIFLTTAYPMNIYGNTVANMTNANTAATGGTYGITTYITFPVAESYSIYNNTIRDITTASTNTNSGSSPSIAGIFYTNSKPANIYGNTIYNLSNSSSAGVSVIGIDYPLANVTTPAANIYGNLIYGLSLSATTPNTGAKIVGLNIINSATTPSINNIDNIYNNMISLGTGINKNHIVTGIYEEGGYAHTFNFYHNSIHIGGTSTSAPSYCFQNAENVSSRNLMNNIFSNARTGNSNTQFGMYITTAGGPVSCNYNDYYISGTGGILGYYGAIKTVLPIVTGMDINSFISDPLFVNANAAIPNLHLSGGTPCESTGILIASVVNDFDNEVRSSLSPVDVGADASDFMYMSIDSDIPESNSITVYPNPADDKLFVNFGDMTEVPVRMKMYNSLGQTVFGSNQPWLTLQTGIDIGSLKTGMYILQIVFDTFAVNKTVLVK